MKGCFTCQAATCSRSVLRLSSHSPLLTPRPFRYPAPAAIRPVRFRRHPRRRAAATAVAIGVLALIAIATAPARAIEWELGGTSTASTPVVIAQATPAVESSVPKNDFGSEARSGESSPESSSGSAAVRTLAKPVAPQRQIEAPRFVSYLALDNGARRRGGYRAGQIVCIGNGIDERQAERMQRHCLEHGWSFCTADQDSLDPGFSWHQGAADGTLRMLDGRPATQARYRPPDAFTEAIPASIRQQPQPVQYAAKAMTSEGTFTINEGDPIWYLGDTTTGQLAVPELRSYRRLGPSAPMQFSGAGSCADGSCGGGQSQGMSYQGGGGFISHMFGGGSGCASCGS